MPKTVEAAITTFNRIIDRVENRCLAVDGPVTPTLQEMDDAELREMWLAVQAIKDGLSRTPTIEGEARVEVTDEMVEAFCLGYWPLHWRDHMDEGDKQGIRQNVRNGLLATLSTPQAKTGAGDRDAAIELAILKCWRELIDLNPAELALRLDERISAARLPSALAGRGE